MSKTCATCRLSTFPDDIDGLRARMAAAHAQGQLDGLRALHTWRAEKPVTYKGGYARFDESKAVEWITKMPFIPEIELTAPTAFCAAEPPPLGYIHPTGYTPSNQRGPIVHPTDTCRHWEARA